jgi:excisionase family DNA binding protein
MFVEEVRQLPLHPDPRETESLWGYILRLSQSNGFRTPWAVIERAGMEQFEARGASIDVPKLAVVTGKDQVRLRSIGYQGGTDKRSHALLGHRVPRTALELALPHMCPECVRGLGFIEAHWDLAIMTACPVHLRSAVQDCAVCGGKLRWFRPDLLHCQCGARIDTMRGTSIAAEEGDLLEVMRAKVLGLLPLIDGSSGIPLNDLWRLELRDLLRLVNVLENCRRKLAGARVNTGDPSTATLAAVGYLRDWPAKFFELLADLRALQADQGTTVRELYSPIYGAFLRRRDRARTDRFDFLRLPFLDFVSNHVEGKAADIRVMRSFGFNVERRFVTRAELARQLMIDPRAVSRSISNESSLVSPGKNFQVIDMQHFAWKGTQPGAILELRAAAKELELPAQVLKALHKNGEFRTDNLSAGHSGFHERDIALFRQRLLKCVKPHPHEGEIPEEDTRLGSVLADRRHSAVDKAALLGELLAGKVTATAGEDQSVIRIRLRTTELEQFWRRRLVMAHGDVLTGTDAAKRLGCSYEVLKSLIEAGKLPGRKSGSSWLIETKGVDAFVTNFVSISDLAQLHSTSSRKIQQICSRRAIPLLGIPLRDDRAKLFSTSKNAKKIRALLGSNCRAGMVSAT